MNHDALFDAAEVERSVLFRKEGNIGIITMNRPERLNAVTPGMLDRVKTLLTEKGAEEDVRVLLITGAGRAFCSGADLKLSAERLDKGLALPIDRWVIPGPGWRRAHPENDLAIVARNCDVPLIAAVNGPAVGVGLLLALFCDIRVASESAKFGAFWIKQGVSPGPGACTFLPRIIGLGNAFRLIYTADYIDAQAALRMGLVNEVVPDNQLMLSAMDMAKRIAAMPAVGISLARRALLKASALNLEAEVEWSSWMQSVGRQTKDRQEGTKAFVEKREPQYGGY